MEFHVGAVHGDVAFLHHCEKTKTQNMFPVTTHHYFYAMHSFCTIIGSTRNRCLELNRLEDYKIKYSLMLHIWYYVHLSSKDILLNDRLTYFFKHFLSISNTIVIAAYPNVWKPSMSALVKTVSYHRHQTIWHDLKGVFGHDSIL